jgi:rubrerythrin
MKTTTYWIEHFGKNALQKRIDWNTPVSITPDETNVILSSLQAWQLGETSEGKHVLKAADKYARAVEEPRYVEAIELFIKEEQKHGNNLGLYLDRIGKTRMMKNWGDSLFRQIRYFNTSMELWTLAVITVESTAQLFYVALRDATSCELLKAICTDILVDEADHIIFQTERLSIIFQNGNTFLKRWKEPAYKLFFFLASQLVWFANRGLFEAGGFSHEKYTHEMTAKRRETIEAAINAQPIKTDKRLLIYE